MRNPGPIGSRGSSPRMRALQADTRSWTRDVGNPVFVNRSAAMPIAPTVVMGKDVAIFQPDLVNLYGCTIGDETKIGAFVEIQKNAVIGRALQDLLAHASSARASPSRTRCSSATASCSSTTATRARPPSGALQTEADWKVVPDPREAGRLDRQRRRHPVRRHHRRERAWSAPAPWSRTTCRPTPSSPACPARSGARRARTAAGCRAMVRVSASSATATGDRTWSATSRRRPGAAGRRRQRPAAPSVWRRCSAATRR